MAPTRLDVPLAHVPRSRERAGRQAARLHQKASTFQLKGALHHRTVEDSMWAQVSGNAYGETYRATGF